MRKIRASVLAGAAMIGAAGAAVAAIQDTHVMKVDLPDGSVARIEYSGNVAPKVVVAPGPALPTTIGYLAPFDVAPMALFDRVFEQMDRQTDRMLRQVAALDAQPVQANGQLNIAARGGLPAGMVRYSFIAAADGKGLCSRSVQVTSLGTGQPPKVISSASGNCAGGPDRTGMPARPQPQVPSATSSAPSAVTNRARTI